MSWNGRRSVLETARLLARGKVGEEANLVLVRLVVT